MCIYSINLYLSAYLACPTALPDRWISYANTHLLSGIATSASDLTGCQSACINNTSCTRLDWNPSGSVGMRCWLHGSWSSLQTRRPARGITHYELTRSYVASWVMYSNMYVFSGVASSAMDLSACKEDCLQNASCTRFDWNAIASVGERCWIHGPWSSSESRRTNMGVEHYELYRGSDELCGKLYLH